MWALSCLNVHPLGILKHCSLEFNLAKKVIAVTSLLWYCCFCASRLEMIFILTKKMHPKCPRLPQAGHSQAHLWICSTILQQLPKHLLKNWITQQVSVPSLQTGEVWVTSCSVQNYLRASLLLRECEFQNVQRSRKWSLQRIYRICLTGERCVIRELFAVKCRSG